MKKYIALLRGINVSGRKLIKMDKLRDIFNLAGCQKVKTYIQSGNVVFSHENTDENDIIISLRNLMLEGLGFDSEIIIRNADEWEDILNRNPFSNKDIDPKKLAISFLKIVPPETTLFEEKTQNFPEEYFIAGQHLYLYYPNGIGRSKLTHNLIEKTLGTTGTTRNLNTCRKLLEMSRT